VYIYMGGVYIPNISNKTPTYQTKFQHSLTLESDPDSGLVVGATGSSDSTGPWDDTGPKAHIHIYTYTHIIHNI
jgi:hypothetical protein